MEGNILSSHWRIQSFGGGGRIDETLMKEAYIPLKSWQIGGDGPVPP